MTDLVELSPAQVAEMRDAWTAAGHDPAQFDLAVSPPAVQDPTGAADGAFPLADDIPAVPILEPVQLQQIAESLRAAGVPEEKIAAAMAADGLPPLAADERDDDEKTYDRAFAPAPPHEYKIDWYGRIPEGMDADSAAAANDEWQQWAADVGFPPQIGPAVVELAVDRGQWLARADETTRALWVAEQEALFAQFAGGAEKVAERLDLVAQALARGSEALIDGLAASGVIYDAEFLSHLANQGERLAWRAGKGREG